MIQQLLLSSPFKICPAAFRRYSVVLPSNPSVFFNAAFKPTHCGVALGNGAIPFVAAVHLRDGDIHTRMRRFQIMRGVSLPRVSINTTSQHLLFRFVLILFFQTRSSARYASAQIFLNLLMDTWRRGCLLRRLRTCLLHVFVPGDDVPASCSHFLFKSPLVVPSEDSAAVSRAIFRVLTRRTTRMVSVTCRHHSSC